LVTGLVTDRLRLREWRPTDRQPFAALNADPRVMAHESPPLSVERSAALASFIERHFERHGFGPWAVEIPGTTSFAGFIGLSVPAFDTHFTPCVAVGMRLAAEYWGHGYATEGAKAVVRFGFEELQLGEIVGFTVPENIRSRRVMEKLAMVHDAADDFDYPSRLVGHPLRRQVLYRMTNPQRPTVRRG
jgi:RimJ/RimL family protein N-acetyltransferase